MLVYFKRRGDCFVNNSLFDRTCRLYIYVLYVLQHCTNQFDPNKQVLHYLSKRDGRSVYSCDKCYQLAKHF